MDSEIQHNLDDDFETQGLLKSGWDLTATTHTVNRDTGTLTKHDAVVWAGIIDISRNESLSDKKIHGEAQSD
jgi:CO dehydrogenase/acetyl-CoA synthase alpha subunit